MSTKFATNYVYMSGLKIYSTEDKEIQQKLEEEYKSLGMNTGLSIFNSLISRAAFPWS